MRPAVAPALLAAATESVNARARKRLDQNPRLAEGWAWATDAGVVTVTTDTGERVRLSPQGGMLQELGQLGCSCLLQPRCLHILAVLSLLPAQLSTPAEEPVAPAPPAEAAVERVALSPAQVRGREAALRLLADLLRLGGGSAGLVLQAALARSAADLGAWGAHRPARALLGLLAALRAARGGDPSGLLDAFAASALALAALEGETVDPSALGEGRRSYTPLPGQRLYGLLAMPIGREGAEGVLTVFVSGKGQLFAYADWGGEVQGAAARALYTRGSRLTTGAPSPEALSRGGAHLLGGTASADRRLGAGAGLALARAEGVHLWEEPLLGLFAEPWPAQQARIAAALGMEQPAAGADLGFVHGRLCGCVAEGLLVEVEGQVVLLVPQSDRPDRPDRENLRRLARVGPIEVFVVGQGIAGKPGRLAALCLGSPDFEPKARFHLGLDRLGAVTLPSAPALPLLELPPTAADPFAALERRLVAVAQGGAMVIGPGLLGILEAEAQALEASLLPGAAGRLRALGAACQGEVDRRRPDGTRLLRAWVQGAAYLAAARQGLVMQKV